MNNITIRDQRHDLGWFSYSDQHGNVLVTAFPQDNDEIKLHFANDVREVIIIAEVLHGTYVLDENSVKDIATAIYREFEARGY